MNDVAGSEPRAARRRGLGFALKVCVTVALLAFVLWRVDLAGVGGALALLGAQGAASALALTVLALVLGALRWRRALAWLGEDVPLRLLLADSLVGMTYNVLLPTSVGGDVVRGLRAAGRVRQAEHAWSSVVFERLLGLFALILLSTIGLFAAPTEATRQLRWLALLGAGGVAVGLLVAPLPLRVAAWAARAGAAQLSEILERTAGALGGPLARVLPRLEMLGWSLLYQLVALSILWFAGLGWHEPGLLRAVFLGVPIALVAAVVPPSVGGLGVREQLFVVVLAPFGLGAERALALSFVWLACNLTLALGGGIVLLVERR